MTQRDGAGVTGPVRAIATAWRWRKYRNFGYVREAFLVATWLLLVFLNPLGLQEAADARSRDVFMRMSAPFYDDSGRDRISLVLIDDATIDQMWDSWPPTYEQYAELVEAVAAGAPAAIFIDLLFLDDVRRGDVDALASTIADVTAMGIPVFLASTVKAVQDAGLCGPSERGGPVVLAPLAQAATDMVFVRTGGAGDYYRITATEVCGPQAEIDRHGGRPWTSPAAALYDLHCGNHPEDCPQGTAPGTTPSGRLTAPMSVRWGEATAPVNHRIYQSDGASQCLELDDGPWSSIGRMIGHFGTGVFDRFSDKTALRPCLYHPHVPAWMAARLSMLAATPAEALPAGDHAAAVQLRDALLHDKYVMIGLDLTGLPDVTGSPVQGVVPGVAKHAMAFDNLLTLHDRYWRPASGLVSGNDLFEGTLLLVFLLVAEFLRHRGQRDRAPDSDASSWAIVAYFRKRPALLATVQALLFCAFVLFVTWVFHALTHLEPMNWLGILAATAAFVGVLFMVPRRRLAEHLDRLADDTPPKAIIREE